MVYKSESGHTTDVDIVTAHGPVEEPVEDKQSRHTPESQEEDEEEDEDTDTDDGGAVGEDEDVDAVKQLKETVSSSIHKLANFDENPMDAKESDMSDTLSPSKDRSSDDTSDGNMDEQDLNEPLNRVALLKEPGDTEQVIHYLHRELLEAQELANTGKQRCQELQALLEEERRSNSQLTEESTKQIQYLQNPPDILICSPLIQTDALLTPV
ncbi:hypothetical protein F2P81_012195 [Scophthalmus maximus]|uniref:Uncharacterized protein n=1 Tax=Scophthalmus maximus TaxID=52904 RepID=A0A6A4SMN1_SCOMX|nr:hypothetical protein F2P81_012195 [Scophthalmus maximus]